PQVDLHVAPEFVEGELVHLLQIVRSRLVDQDVDGTERLFSARHQAVPAPIGIAQVTRHYESLATDRLDEFAGPLETVLGPGAYPDLRSSCRQTNCQSGTTSALTGPGDQRNQAITFAHVMHFLTIE